VVCFHTPGGEVFTRAEQSLTTRSRPSTLLSYTGRPSSSDFDSSLVGKRLPTDARPAPSHSRKVQAAYPVPASAPALNLHEPADAKSIDLGDLCQTRRFLIFTSPHFTIDDVIAKSPASVIESYTAISVIGMEFVMAQHQVSALKAYQNTECYVQFIVASEYAPKSAKLDLTLRGHDV